MDDFFKRIEENLSCPVALGRILIDIIDGGALGNHLVKLLETIRDGNPTHLGGTNTFEMAIHIQPEFSLSLRKAGGDVNYVDRASRTQSYIHTAGRTTLSLIPPTPIVFIERYALSDDQKSIILQSRSENTGIPILEDVEARDVVHFDCPEGHCWFLRLTYGQHAPVTRFYHRDSLEYAFSSAVRGEFSSLVTLCRVFGDSGDEASLTYLHELSDHSAHFVRWAAIQAIGRIDGELACARLKTALKDDHPQIRQAASRSLAKMGAL